MSEPDFGWTTCIRSRYIRARTCPVSIYELTLSLFTVDSYLMVGVAKEESPSGARLPTGVPGICIIDQYLLARTRKCFYTLNDLSLHISHVTVLLRESRQGRSAETFDSALQKGVWNAANSDSRSSAAVRRETSYTEYLSSEMPNVLTVTAFETQCACWTAFHFEKNGSYQGDGATISRKQ